jgi:hypothetical protein
MAGYGLKGEIPFAVKIILIRNCESLVYNKKAFRNILKAFLFPLSRRDKYLE